MRRLLSLDYIIERQTFGWLPTEADKVQRFEALGIDRTDFPYRMYGPEGKPKIPRYFAFKLPIAVDDQAATFAYVDAGQTTDSELCAWGMAHAPLWAALRARTFAVHVVAVGTGADAADRTLLAPFGGFRAAVDRLKALRQLPEGTPTRTTARGAIDRFKIWSTVRLITPEAAS